MKIKTLGTCAVLCLASLKLQASPSPSTFKYNPTLSNENSFPVLTRYKTLEEQKDLFLNKKIQLSKKQSDFADSIISKYSSILNVLNPEDTNAKYVLRLFVLSTYITESYLSNPSISNIDAFKQASFTHLIACDGVNKLIPENNRRLIRTVLKDLYDEIKNKNPIIDLAKVEPVSDSGYFSLPHIMLAANNQDSSSREQSFQRGYKTGRLEERVSIFHKCFTGGLTLLTCFLGYLTLKNFNKAFINKNKI